MSAVGTCVKGEAVCFLPTEKASNVHVGDVASVDGELMEVASIGVVPFSRAEAREIVGSDYLLSTIVQDDWTYIVHFGGNTEHVFPEGVPLAVTITTERIPPMSAIFKDAS